VVHQVVDDFNISGRYSLLSIIGDAGSGKSTLLNRYTDIAYTHRPELEIIEFIDVNFVERNVFVNGLQTILVISCFDMFDFNFANVMKISGGVIILFDVTNYQSFVNVKGWFNEIRRLNKEVVVIIVANKIDLTGERVILEEDIKILADELGVIYMNISATMSTEIEIAVIFEYILRYGSLNITEKKEIRG